MNVFAAAGEKPPPVQESSMRVPLSSRCALLAVLLMSCMVARAADGSVPDTLRQRIAACTSCHGEHGEGGANGFNPRIAGKPSEYLFRQLVNFREGRRDYPVMEYMVRALPDAYLHEIADYFAGQHAAYPARHPPQLPDELRARGRQLVRHGDAALRIPPCQACHGVRLTGLEPGVPGLVGLPYDYLSAQLGAWRTHTRGAAAPDCMAQVAGRLRQADITAVAAWLASQPVPGDASPMPADSRPQPPPMRCGSMQEAAP